MDKDRKESRGRGTLLLIMKQDPKACVSCLKEFIEFGLRPSNHLITISPKLGREYFAHQSLIFKIDSHPLVELAYVLYKVRSTVVHSESRLMELPREFYPFYLVCEG